MESLYLIDVSALAYRSFYAFINNPLKNSKGQETSAIFGFASHTLRLIQECEPTHIAFVKDLPKRTFRHELYKEYKAHRKPMPDSLQSQLPIIDAFVATVGLRTVALEGFEADDVMATLACDARKRGMKVYIVTRDKDMMQLVDDQVKLFDLGKARADSLVVGPKEVKEKMGVDPAHIVDYLSLIGDASDNVPGVAKIGPKTAVELIDTYGSLERIYEFVENIPKKGLRENLKNDRESAFLSQKLVTLNCELELPLGVDDLRYSGVAAEATSEFLIEWEFKSLLRLVPGSSTAAVSAARAKAFSAAAAAESALASPGGDTAVLTLANGSSSAAELAEAIGEATVPEPAGPPGPELRYELIDTLELLSAMADRIKAAPPLLAVDTETTDLDNKVARLVGVCLSVEAYTGFYIPVGHQEGRNLPLEDVQRVLKPILDDPSRRLLFHNAKYDLPILARHGLLPADIGRPGKLADTMVAAYLSNPGERQLSLDDLALRHFGHAMIPIEKLIGKGGRGAANKQKNFSEVSIAEACTYGAEDADMTYRLWELYEKDLKQKELFDLFFEMEMALLPVLLEMEGKGITLDVEALNALSEILAAEIVRLEREIHELAGEEFNIGSPTQLQVILFEKLGLKPGKKTKTGFSTDADVLSKLEGEHPIISKLLDHRESTKLQNTYVEALPTMVHPVTGRVHTNYSQVIAATGRLSSINPNLQNIPIRTESGRLIRKCFVASSPDRILLCADYSQIELRLLAHLSGDPTLREAYRRNMDIHTRTAAILYKVPESEVTSNMRRSAKVVNFGVLYGMGSGRLAAQLKIPRSEAAQFIDNYFSTFSMVDKYITGTVDKGRSLGYVETLAGRKRYLPDLLSDNRMMKENAERIAANTPIQGSAADLIKIAMIRIHNELAGGSLKCDMLLQVHDELVFEVDRADADAAERMIKTEMEGAMQLEVPLVVEFGRGPNWLEAHN
ncbi:MAG: polymerase [Fibrobacteres bacterium]|nr:polymerase [Fibrobacterota bacterium]